MWMRSSVLLRPFTSSFPPVVIFHRLLGTSSAFMVHPREVPSSHSIPLSAKRALVGVKQRRPRAVCRAAPTERGSWPLTERSRLSRCTFTMATKRQWPTGQQSRQRQTTAALRSYLIILILFVSRRRKRVRFELEGAAIRCEWKNEPLCFS